METEKWKRARMVAFNARIGSHLDSKSLPKSEEQFLPLEKRTAKRILGVSDETKDLFKQRMKEYNDAMDAYNSRK